MKSSHSSYVPLRKKLNFNLILTFGGIFVILLISYITSLQLKSLHYLILAKQENKISIIKLNNMFLDIRSQLHDLFYHPNKVSPDQIITKNEAVLSEFEGLKKNLNNQDNLKSFYKIIEYEPVIYSLRNHFYILVSLYNQNKNKEAKKLLAQKINIWISRITQLVQEIQSISKEEIALATKRAQIKSQRAIAIEILLTLILVLLILGRNLKVIQNIVNPIGKLAELAKQIGHGSFGITCNISSNDEIGDLSQAFNSMSEELSQAESERKRLQSELVHFARQVGMSELATGVLHNVGNILSSVNILTHQINTKIKHSSACRFAQIVPLIEENVGRLDEYFAKDEKGKLVLPLLLALKEAQQKEAKELASETSKLKENIEDIIKIVSVQQSVAGIKYLIEEVSLNNLIDQAIQVNAAALQRHHAEVTKDYQNDIVINSDRLKILQILINLISNAKYALLDTPDKKIKITLKEIDSDRIQIQIIDNGQGIDKENLVKIFQYGFTTKPDGHGFGLHHSCLAAKDLGGELLASSDGKNEGATFSLIIPRNSKGALQNGDK